MQALRKFARYIKGTLHYKLNIRPRHNTDLKIEAYTDADWCLMVLMSLLGHEIRALCHERRSGGGVGLSRAPH